LSEVPFRGTLGRLYQLFKRIERLRINPEQLTLAQKKGIHDPSLDDAIRSTRREGDQLEIKVRNLTPKLFNVFSRFSSR
jgi:hypothetical protein